MQNLSILMTKMSNSLKNISSSDILFRLVKVSDIAYIAVLYFIVGYNAGTLINYVFTSIFGNYERKPNYILLMEVLLQIIVIGIFSYIGRNIVQLIPSPFSKINDFDHNRVKELTSGSFLTTFMVMFQYSMQDKLMYIKNRKKKKE